MTPTMSVVVRDMLSALVAEDANVAALAMELERIQRDCERHRDRAARLREALMVLGVDERTGEGYI